ncbi:hypothetical protein [Halocola ammonii]
MVKSHGTLKVKIAPTLLLTFSLFLSVFTGFGQSSESPLSYFEIENLSVEEYSKLKSAVAGDSRFQIASACIPASVLEVKVVGTFSSQKLLADAFTDLVRKNTALSEVELLSDFNEEKFMVRCKEFRTRRN